MKEPGRYSTGQGLTPAQQRRLEERRANRAVQILETWTNGNRTDAALALRKDAALALRVSVYMSAEACLQLALLIEESKRRA